MRKKNGGRSASFVNRKQLTYPPFSPHVQSNQFNGIVGLNIKGKNN